jgi:hypothetical protein
MDHGPSRYDLARRVQAVRLDVYGECGGPMLAKQLRVPYRTWMKYEGGEMMPAEVLLRFIALTNVNPNWLLKGRGKRYRTGGPPDTPHGPAA